MNIGYVHDIERKQVGSVTSLGTIFSGKYSIASVDDYGHVHLYITVSRQRIVEEINFIGVVLEDGTMYASRSSLSNDLIEAIVWRGRKNVLDTLTVNNQRNAWPREQNRVGVIDGEGTVCDREGVQLGVVVGDVDLIVRGGAAMILLVFGLVY